MSDSLRPCGQQHARLPCPSPTPGACSNPCPLSWWCHPTISSFVVPFSCLQSFKWVASGGQSIGVSASALGGWEEGSRGREHMYTCDWFMLMYGRNQHNIVIILQLKINYKNPFLPVFIGKIFSLVSSISFMFVFTKINLVHVCACT